jgi:hypothetical protein
LSNRNGLFFFRPFELWFFFKGWNNVQEWMDYRKKSGEEINGESWVMRTLWNTTDPKSDAKSSNKMCTAAIRVLVQRALRSQGLRTTMIAHRHEFKTNHGFRKFFQTNAEPKMKSLDVITLMRQDTGLAASYNKPTVEMLLTEYLKAVENLTISRVQTNEEVIRNQQTLAMRMQIKDREINELKQQVEELRSSYEDFIKRNVTVSNFTKDGVEILDRFGNRISSRPLTKEERKKIDESLATAGLNS